MALFYIRFDWQTLTPPPSSFPSSLVATRRTRHKREGGTLFYGSHNVQGNVKSWRQVCPLLDLCKGERKGHSVIPPNLRPFLLFFADGSLHPPPAPPPPPSTATPHLFYCLPPPPPPPFCQSPGSLSLSLPSLFFLPRCHPTPPTSRQNLLVVTRSLHCVPLYSAL